MSISNSLGRCLSVMAVACSLLAVAAPTQAAVVATFDPAFGLDRIPNLGFRGTVTLDVSAGCYSTAAASEFSYAFTGGTCTITPISGELNFYNATNDPGATAIFTGSTIDLLPYLQADWVIGAYFDPLTNAFAGFDTFDSLPFFVSVHDSSSAPIDYDGDMLLYFVSDHEPFTEVGLVSRDPAFLVDCNPANSAETTCDRFSGAVSDPADVTFAVIPEPDSIALSLLGLGALLAARRRKSIAR